MTHNPIIAVKASGYKTHLCSSEEQAQSVIRDIKTRMPDSKCESSKWTFPHLSFDDGKPFVKDSDFITISLSKASLKFCVADFMSLACCLEYSKQHPIDNFVFLTSSLYCSVLTLAQANELSEYLKSNFDNFKKLEDAYYITHAEKLKMVEDKLVALVTSQHFGSIREPKKFRTN